MKLGKDSLGISKGAYVEATRIWQEETGKKPPKLSGYKGVIASVFLSLGGAFYTTFAVPAASNDVNVEKVMAAVDKCEVTKQDPEIAECVRNEVAGIQHDETIEALKLGAGPLFLGFFMAAGFGIRSYRQNEKFAEFKSGLITNARIIQAKMDEGPSLEPLS